MCYQVSQGMAMDQVIKMTKIQKLRYEIIKFFYKFY